MRYLAATLLAAAATPALAQHHHHAAPAEAQAASPPRGATGADAPDPHAGHDQPETPPPSPPADAHAGHAMPSSSPQETRGAHAEHAADAIFGTAAMAPAREVARKEHGDIISGTILVDQLEATIGKGKDGFTWKAEAWHGGDINRLRLTSEGEGRFGENPEQAEIQALWSLALDPWWNLQTGIRQDFGTGPEPTYAALGVQGLAPFWFDLGGTLFLSHKGNVTARIEVEYDQRLTRKLILQPRAELNLAAQDVAELGMGAGLATAELGLRLRYQFVPEIAPYVGVAHESALGQTANYRKADGKPVHSTRFVAGLRFWF